MRRFHVLPQLGLVAALSLSACASAQDVAQTAAGTTSPVVTAITSSTPPITTPTLTATPTPTSISTTPAVTTHTATATPVAEKPAVGNCYNTGKRAFQRQRDASPPIGCQQQHTAETFAVVDASTEPKRTEIDRAWRECQARFRSYVGDSATVSKLGLTVILPTPDQALAHGGWIRCDAIQLPNYNGKAGVPRTGSLQGVLAGQVPRQFRGCVRHWPKVDQPVHFTSCDENHQAELIPESINLGGPEAKYPGLTSAKNDSKSFCESVFQDYVPETRNYYYYYPTATSWRSGSHDTTCWALDTLGDGLPPI